METRTIELKYAKEGIHEFRHATKRARVENNGNDRMVIKMIGNPDYNCESSLAKEILEDRHNFSILSQQMEEMRKDIQILKEDRKKNNEENERNKLYLMLGSYITFVREFITKEIYDSDDEYKPYDIYSFNQELKNQVNGERKIAKILKDTFNMTVSEWFNLSIVSRERNYIAHPEIEDIQKFSSFINQEEILKDKYALFENIYEVYKNIRK